MSITTTALSRSFGDVHAVRELTLALPTHGVVGLVGPNGSGKSTLIRMLLGLVQPSGGEATVLGHPISRPRDYAHHVGALIENPAFVPGLSARANLRSLVRLRGLPNSRVDEVIEAVGLAGREDEPVARFSLGMKQRLGIAAALLPDPQVLILDEPTNGLDPAGIVEIRGLLHKLGRSGRTVVVSSHLLSEIETICSYLVIIRFGVLMYAGTVNKLLSRAKTHVHTQPERREQSAALALALRAAGWNVLVDDPPADDSRLEVYVRVEAPMEAAATINRDAAHAGFTLASLTSSRDSLESIFLEMTGSDDSEVATR
ncbi:MAG: ATP-binding cassette domain-containing protein [Ornithinimicrobium sp.]